MKKHFTNLIYFIFILFVLCACTNEPIFYRIALEYEQRDPIVAGSPTNFAFFNDDLFVASGNTLFYYTGAEEGRDLWIKVPLTGLAGAIASTDDCLYVLQATENKNEICKFDTSLNIVNLDLKNISHLNILSLFTANNELFVSAGIGNYSIYHYNENAEDENKFTEISTDRSLRILRGALYHNGEYYFCTSSIQTETDGAIYKAAELSEGAAAMYPDERTIASFVGMIHLGETFVAITRNGTLYNENGEQVKYGANVVNLLNYKATGGLAVFEGTDEGGNPFSLLLAGRQDDLSYSASTGYTYGYLELTLNNGKLGEEQFFRVPGEHPSSIDNFARYSSSLGKYPVKQLAQAKDGTLFAATQKNGVWSYRVRPPDNFATWNAED